MKVLSLSRLEQSVQTQAMVAELAKQAVNTEQFGDRFIARGKRGSTSFSDRFIARGKSPVDVSFSDRFIARGKPPVDVHSDEQFIVCYGKL